MPEIGLQRFALSLQPFDQTPEPERVKIHWLNPSIQVQVKTRLVLWAQYCPATVLGYWGTSETRVILRYMPCIELTGQGKLCAEHQALVPAPELTPAPEPAPTVVRPVRTAAVRALPQESRCQDCGDVLPSWRQIPRCVRCNKVRLQAAAQAREQRPQVERPAPTYHCLACKRTFTMQVAGRRLCPRCFEERYVDQPSEDDGALVRNTGAMPHLAFYMNRRGESVVKGRILPHPRYGESPADRFGD